MQEEYFRSSFHLQLGPMLAQFEQSLMDCKAYKFQVTFLSNRQDKRLLNE